MPAVVRVKRTIRPRYACRACESAIVQAPAPARVMDGGMVTTAFAAHVAVSKFAWHLPLHRQAQMLASCGVIIDRGTLGAWVTRIACRCAAISVCTKRLENAGCSASAAAGARATSA